MAQLAIHADLALGPTRLENSVRKRILELVDIFQRSTAAQLAKMEGVQLETHKDQLDPRARTIRVTKNFRGIVYDFVDGEKFLLYKILPHKDSDRWMERNRFAANVQTGAIEVWDMSAVEGTIAELKPVEDKPLLYEHRPDKHFRQVGVPEKLVPALRAFTSEDELLAMLAVLPPTQCDALMLLLGTDSPDTIFNEIAGDFVPGSIDETEVGKAIDTPASQGQIHVVTDDDDLRMILTKPMSRWRIFLHASQRQVAYKPTFNGPARVTGGAGTGKTVVAMHRAKFLADNLDRAVSGKPILFTTFTKNLAEAIRRDLRDLGGNELLDAVEVIHVDQLANRIVREAEGSSPTILKGRKLEQVWDDVVDEIGSPHPAAFLANEWEQVVLARGCQSRADYLMVSRAGRGIQLNRRDRAEVWKAIESFNQKLVEMGARNFAQVAEEAASYLTRRTVRPYRHVIVDEAQDLHESQWRMLRAVVAEGPNDMFIVGDSHQRIYDRRTSLSKMGINIVGRSRKLHINYRTTHEILRWSLALLGEESYDDLDDGIDTQDVAGYHSFLRGGRPVMSGHSTRDSQYAALAEQITEWIVGDVGEEDVAIAARTNKSLDDVEAELEKAGIAVCRLRGELPKGDGVRLGTMHRVKGLEFRCVAVIDADDDNVPIGYALTSATADPVQHRTDLIRERCLLYVACTRARDNLWVGWSGTPSRFLGPMLGD